MSALHQTEQQEYTIDELATAARVPSRTIRFYQSRGALMPPEIRGRTAYYGRQHVERLALIAQLQDRGLRIDAISDLLASIDRGEVDLAEWLGVGQQVQVPWAEDQPRTVTEEELYALAGNSRPGLIADLTRVNLVKRHGDVYLLRSPALLSIAMKLEAAGIDLRTADLAEQVIRKYVGRAARELVQIFAHWASDGKQSADQIAKALEALRPLSLETVRIDFAHAVEQELRDLFESGRAARIPVRAHRSRKNRR